MKRSLLFTAIFFCCFFKFSNAQPGAPDSSFGKDGIVTADLGSSYNYRIVTKKVLVQPDGSIFLVIVTRNETMVAKRQPNGLADSSYGHNGFSSKTLLSANDAALQPDGKIVIAGTANADFVIVRYNTDGTPDKTFSDDGKQSTDIDNTDDQANALALQPDGKIIVIGTGIIKDFEGYPQIYLAGVARYNTDGSLDNTFSEDGKEDIYLPDEFREFGNAVAVQKDGKILLVAGGYSTTLLIRYTSNGTRDSTFSDDGYQSADIRGKCVAIQSDGKILLGASTLARYKIDGTTDNTFGEDGKQSTGYNISSLVILSDGKILAGGGSTLSRFNTNGSVDNTFDDDGKKSTGFNISSLGIDKNDKMVVTADYNTPDFDFSLALYNKDGSADNNFTKIGKLPLAFLAGNTFFASTKIQKNGKIVAAGGAWNGSNHDLALVRYNADGSPDNAFGIDGISITSLSSKDDHINSIALLSDGKIIVAAEAFDTCYNFRCHYLYFILRYKAGGTPDSSFDGDGILPADLEIASLAIQTDGKIVAVGRSGSDFAIIRYNIDGTPDNSFSEDGKQITTFTDDDDYPWPSRASSVAIETDGKIVVGGIMYSEYNDHVVVCYNTDGSVAWQRGVFGDAESGCSIAIQSDGKIVIGGHTYYRGYNHIKIARINPDGSFDASFINTEYGGEGNRDAVSAIAIQDDDKIILAGTAVFRYNPDGSFDSSFGDKGIQRTANLRISSIAISDKLYAAGSGNLYGRVGIIARFLLGYNSPVPPKVDITTPENNTTYLKGGNIYLNATVSDEDGTISKVEFYNGSKLLYSTTDTPYYFKWPNAQLGNYKLTARATDNTGLVTISDTVNISVVPNKPPKVSIITPANNQTFAESATIHFEAVAQDIDGRMGTVEFYNGSTLLAIERKIPYTYDWVNVPAGTYTITARARDNWGGVTISAPVTVTVIPGASLVSSRPSALKSKTNKTEIFILTLAPNPAKNTINIYTSGLQKSKQATLSVISATGVIIKTMRVAGSDQSIPLNISSLVSGMYTVKLMSGDKTMYRKFVKL